MIPVEERLIVALDAPSLEVAEKWLSELKGVAHFYKIGLELFTAHGWKAVNLVKNYGSRVFLDLKLHDIPNTVSRTLKAVCEHGVDIVNIHALGGFEMMKMARQAVFEYSGGRKQPKLIGVTVLTSHSQETLGKELCIKKKVKDEVLHLADMAKKAGLDGVVCSPQETAWVRKKCGKDFLIVTPGVRPSGSALGDQKRVETPENAIRAGADHVVVGRPITQSSNPREAAVRIMQAIAAL
jgi:orotidine-5'-phosphate decarboxylase